MATPLEILDQRLARGELEPDEYERLRQALADEERAEPPPEPAWARGLPGDRRGPGWGGGGFGKQGPVARCWCLVAALVSLTAFALAIWSPTSSTGYRVFLFVPAIVFSVHTILLCSRQRPLFSAREFFATAARPERRRTNQVLSSLLVLLLVGVLALLPFAERPGETTLAEADIPDDLEAADLDPLPADWLAAAAGQWQCEHSVDLADFESVDTVHLGISYALQINADSTVAYSGHEMAVRLQNGDEPIPLAARQFFGLPDDADDLSVAYAASTGRWGVDGEGRVGEVVETRFCPPTRATAGDRPVSVEEAPFWQDLEHACEDDAVAEMIVEVRDNETLAIIPVFAGTAYEEMQATCTRG